VNREQLDRYRKQLRSLLDRVRGTAAGLEETVRTPTGGESAGGISNAPIHLGDVGSEAYTQELNATLLENETYIRDESAAALERIDRGTYGKCENCGKDIIHERLDAIPYARHCTPCAGKLQEGAAVNLNNGRPAEWLGEPGHEGLSVTGSPDRVVGRNLGGAPGDVHAVGTPGGGTAVGGLAGTNVGSGSPRDVPLEAAMAEGIADAPEDADGEDQPEAFSGPSGGAVGGTPANKRSRGGLPAPKAERKTKKKGRAKRSPE
jgi:RNA polymerase-binding transcription factor DksA